MFTNLKTKLKKLIDYNQYSHELNKVLNIDNLEDIKKKELKHIEKVFTSKNLDRYKKELIFKWDKVNREMSLAYSIKLKRLIKKLNVNLFDYEKQQLADLDAKIFTSIRAFKSLELPFAKTFKIKDEFALFVYKKVRLYLVVRGAVKFIKETDMYVLKNKIYFYDPLDKKIFKIITVPQINKVIKLKRYTKLVTVEDDYGIWYKDNDVIFTSFQRAFKKRTIYQESESKVKKDNFANSQKTMEVLLDY